MLLKQFNGGLNIRQSPELIPPNKSVECLNVDLTSDVIEGAKGPGSTSLTQQAMPYFASNLDQWYADAHIRSYLPFKSSLLYSDGVTAKKIVSGTTYNLGITAPTAAPLLTTTDSVLAPPVFTVTTHRYKPIAEISPRTGNFPHPAISLYFGFVYLDGKTIAVIKYTETAATGYHITLGTSIPDGASIVGGRAIGRVIYQLPSFDDTFYDISSQPVLGHTIGDFTDIQVENEPYSGALTGMVSFSATLVEGSRYSALAHAKTVDCTDSWVELHSDQTLEAGQSIDYYLGKTKLSSSTVTRFDQAMYGQNWKSTGVVGVTQYVYTYYNVSDGTESSPSPVSDEVEAASGEVRVSVLASSDPQVTHIKIYRVNPEVLSFTEVAELPNVTTTYTDAKSTTELEGRSLRSSFNGPAPTGLKYLTQNRGTFFGAVDTKVYFSQSVGNPNYWPQSNYLEFAEQITGLALSSSGLIVFTRKETHLISGLASNNFTQYLLSSSIGCISHNSIAPKDGGALFVSEEGISFVSGSKVDTIAKYELGRQSLDVVNAVVHHNNYYCQLSQGKILAFETDLISRFVEYDFSTSWLALKEDKLCGVINGHTRELFAGDPVPYRYKTGEYTEGNASQLKHYKSIYLTFEGSLTISVSIDGIEAITKTLQAQRLPTELNIPQGFQKGTRISFTLTGTGKVKEIEYKVQGRENGK